MSQWYGVRTDESGRVTSLELNNNNLSGPIPAALERLSHLVILSLSFNNLGGTIPAEMANLTNLQEVSLGLTNLSGPIPAWWGRLPYLRSLVLQGNNLSGPIPAELGNLNHLAKLLLDGNNLSGPIPAALERLSNSLQFLSLGFNNLSGSIPAWMGNLTRLRILSLEFSNLSGPVPAALGNLTLLERLNLGGNALTGELPASLTNLRKLSIFWFQDNAGLCAPATSAFRAWLDGIADVDGPTCDSSGGNRAPELYRALPGLTLQVGGTAVTVTLGDHFRDPDEDELGYSTVTTPAGVVNVTKPRNSDVLTFEPVAAGTATVRVTAQDPGRLFARGTIEVTVNPAGNRAPELYRALPGLTLQVGGTAVTVTLGDHFRDPDEDELGYSTVTTPAGVVNVTKPRNSDVLTFEPVAAGTATVRVTAQDPGRLFARGTIEVTVNPAGNRAPELYRALPGLTLQVGGTAVTVTLGDHFRDPDEDELGYSTVTTPAGVVNVTKPRNSDVLTFEPVAAGTATVRVTAQDPGRLFTRGTIEVTVNPAAGAGTARLVPEVLYDATDSARWRRNAKWKKAELGNLTRLERLYLSRNTLSGELPASPTNLREMRIFWFHDNAGLCAPPSPAFGAWFDGIADWRGITCGQTASSARPGRAGPVLEAFHIEDAAGGRQRFRHTQGKTALVVGEWLGVTSKGAGGLPRFREGTRRRQETL